MKMGKILALIFLISALTFPRGVSAQNVYQVSVIDSETKLAVPKATEQLRLYLKN